MQKYKKKNEHCGSFLYDSVVLKTKAILSDMRKLILTEFIYRLKHFLEQRFIEACIDIAKRSRFFEFKACKCSIW